MQVHQKIPLVHGHVVQRALEHLSRALVEFPGEADEYRAAAVLDVNVDNVFCSPHPKAPDPRGRILA
ncbi:hypothetical protein [Streptomyces vinaceus]|uniref:hypothetical protein n=1 Tax=Streptomyces vinaceus TaxID=1960 RepID=UPI0035DBF269